MFGRGVMPVTMRSAQGRGEKSPPVPRNPTPLDSPQTSLPMVKKQSSQRVAMTVLTRLSRLAVTAATESAVEAPSLLFSGSAWIVDELSLRGRQPITGDDPRQPFRLTELQTVFNAQRRYL